MWSLPAMVLELGTHLLRPRKETLMSAVLPLTAKILKRVPPLMQPKQEIVMLTALFRSKILKRVLPLMQPKQETWRPQSRQLVMMPTPLPLLSLPAKTWSWPLSATGTSTQRRPSSAPARS